MGKKKIMITAAIALFVMGGAALPAGRYGTAFLEREKVEPYLTGVMNTVMTLWETRQKRFVTVAP